MSTSSDFHFDDTLKPRHPYTYRALGVNSQFTDFQNIVLGQKAYTTFFPLATGSAFTNLHQSGYVYLFPNVSSVSLVEYVNVLDSLSASSHTPGGTDYGNVLDQLTTKVITTYPETVGVLDQLTVTQYFPFSYYGSVVVQVNQAINPQSTNILAVQEFVNGRYSTNSVIFENNLAVVTNATGIGNPFTPTLILNGKVVYSQPGSVPAASGNASCYVGFGCSNLIDALGAQDIAKWNLNLADGTGSWKTDTFTDLGAYGSQSNLFGLTGTITKKGYSYPGAPFINGGIFGVRNMNKEFIFLITGSKFAFNNVNPLFAAIKAANYQSHSAAVQYMASITGTKISWGIPDLPLKNFIPQASQKAIDAIQSLAGECGGTLRWMGNTSYKVLFPDQSIGVFQVPDCCLVTAVNGECDLDLNTGIYSPGVYMVPQLGLFDAGTSNTTKTSPTQTNRTLGSTNQVQVEDRFGPSTKLITTDDPKILIDLPWDFDDIFMQIVTATDATGRFVTFDPSKYFLFDAAFAGRYVNYIDVGGVLKPVLIIDSTLFPQTNNDVINGHWYWKIGITRKKLNPSSNQSDADQAQTIGRNILKYRFVPVCTGSLTTIFFGSIPLPGMTLVADFNGKHITGIIESVSFTDPGIITVNYVQWARLQYYQNLSGFDNTATISL